MVAEPLLQVASPSHSTRRRLQQLAQNVLLASPEMVAWMEKAAKAWQAQGGVQGFMQKNGINPAAFRPNQAATAATVASSLSASPFASSLSGLANSFSVPTLPPEALKSISAFIDAASKGLKIESSIGSAVEKAMDGMSLSNFRITPASLAHGRRLRQAAVENDDTAAAKKGASKPTVVADLIGAMESLAAAGPLLEGPGSSVKLPLPADTIDAASARRLLSTPEDDDFNSIATQLQRQVGEAVASLKSLGSKGGGAIVPAQLTARAAGLKERYNSLKTSIETASTKAQRRLLQEDGDDGGDSFSSDEAEQLENPPYSHSQGSPTKTMIIVMQTEDIAASTAFIHDILGFLSESIHSAMMPPPAALQRNRRSMDAPEEGEYLADELEEEDASSGYYYEVEMVDYAAQDENNEDESSRRRRLLSSPSLQSSASSSSSSSSAVTPPQKPASSSSSAVTPQKPASSSSSSDSFSYDYEYDLDAVYAEEDAWMWAAGDEDWMSSEASVEEAVLRYVDEANETELIDLVVRLAAPLEEGGISPALLQILSDPQGRSVADLLKELAASPAGSELNVANRGSEVPRFAIFGPSAMTGFNKAAAVGAHKARPQQDARDGSGKVVEMVVTPLRGPRAHTDRDSPNGGMDARWWGVTLGLGSLCLFLIGASAVAALQTYVYTILHGKFDLKPRINVSLNYVTCAESLEKCMGRILCTEGCRRWAWRRAAVRWGMRQFLHPLALGKIRRDNKTRSPR